MTVDTKPLRKCLALSPIVNIFGQFFIAVPDPDTTEKVLNIIGVVSALLLVVIYAVPGTVTRDELVEVDTRFGYTAATPDGIDVTPEQAWWRSRFSRSPSWNLGAFTSGAGFCLSVVFLTVILQYMFLGFARAMIERTPRDQRGASWARWFKFNAFMSIILILLLLGGLTSFYIAVYVLCIIKWPDYGLLSLPQNGTAYSRSELMKASSAYSGLMVLNVMLPLAVAFLAVLGGVSNYLVFRNSELLDNPSVNAVYPTSPKTSP